MIAHQREQWADQNRRAGALLAQKFCREEIDETLSPSGALNHEDSGAASNDGVDGLPLAFAKPSLRSDHLPQ